MMYARVFQFSHLGTPVVLGHLRIMNNKMKEHFYEPEVLNDFKEVS